VETGVGEEGEATQAVGAPVVEARRGGGAEGGLDGVAGATARGEKGGARRAGVVRGGTGVKSAGTGGVAEMRSMPAREVGLLLGG